MRDVSVENFSANPLALNFEILFMLRHRRYPEYRVQTWRSRNAFLERDESRPAPSGEPRALILRS